MLLYFGILYFWAQFIVSVVLKTIWRSTSLHLWCRMCSHFKTILSFSTLLFLIVVRSGQSAWQSAMINFLSPLALLYYGHLIQVLLINQHLWLWYHLQVLLSDFLFTWNSFHSPFWVLGSKFLHMFLATSCTSSTFVSYHIFPKIYRALPWLLYLYYWDCIVILYLPLLYFVLSINSTI